MRPLIVCRGPVRREAIDIFHQMGMQQVGILLSEKDSIQYQGAMAPELRIIEPQFVHRVSDYMDATDRSRGIANIIQIALRYDYNAIFAGYGFMAEDAHFVSAIEEAGLNFIGPCSKVMEQAGLKDEARRTANDNKVSIVPGIDDLTIKTLLDIHPDVDALLAINKKHNLGIKPQLLRQNSLSLKDKASTLLNMAEQKKIDLFTLEQLFSVAAKEARKIFQEYPDYRVRLKAVGGGGGKGQRIVNGPSHYSGDPNESMEQCLEKIPSLATEALAEVKALAPGANKNFLIELNLENIRHLEIQVLGNSDWVISLGARDCSLQMHEQKLLEISLISEDLQEEINFIKQSNKEESSFLEQELRTLHEMEAQAERFSHAVGLDSASTFECIVSGDKHFFMEMNTRIQVEHRITEMCYSLRFNNPENNQDYFIVDSLIEAMAIIARHGRKLPHPERIPHNLAAAEIRLNATNDALAPHAGGWIEWWSDKCEGELRDEQGICVLNPDSDEFMNYQLSGAYDSNIALLASQGKNRKDCLANLLKIVCSTYLGGNNLSTNIDFHHGLLGWILGENSNTRPTTNFVPQYLAAVGRLRETAQHINLAMLYQMLGKLYINNQGDDLSRQKYTDIFSSKQTLIIRPIKKLFDKPHLLSGWLGLFRHTWQWENGKVIWHINPLELLHECYSFLDMEKHPERPAIDVIWEHDQRVLEHGLEMYEELYGRLGSRNFSELHNLLDSPKATKEALGLNNTLSKQVNASHRGFLAGLELFTILPYLNHVAGFSQLYVGANLSPVIPEELSDKQFQQAMYRVLAPPPTSIYSDEIIAESGGVYYSREAPEAEAFVKEGQTFVKGEPLYIVEVMKMFNKVVAPCDGEIAKILITNDGEIIQKGQPLFKLKPQLSNNKEEKKETDSEEKMQMDDAMNAIKNNLFFI